MRTIKFRYVYQHQETGQKESRDYTLDGNGGTKYLLPFWRLIARDQFTGFVDKCGNDIYDGDLCRCYAKDGSPMICAVQMVEGVWAWGDNPDDRLYQWLRDSDMEIIGNIYENPELLMRNHGVLRKPCNH